MSDIAFWEKEWVEKVFERIEREKDRIFLFLTKAPKSYRKFPVPLPSNVWLGISATDTVELIERGKELLSVGEKTPTGNLFVSLEPLYEEINFSTFAYDVLENVGWVIVGPETGSLRKELRDSYRKNFRRWVESLRSFCKDFGIPLFLKDACAKYGIELQRKFPVWRW